MSSAAYIDGYYYKPRSDWELLERHHEGLIATTGCLVGLVCQLILDDRLEVGSSFAGAPVVGRIADLRRMIPALSVNQVFVGVPGASNEEILHLIKACDDLQAEFKLVPDLLEIMSTRAAVDAIDGLPLVGIRRSRLRGPAAVLKRAIDIIVSAVLLVITSPFMLVIAILIKLTSPAGPVLFRQPRVGLHDRRFTVYKFRSMIPDAEAETGPVVASPNDDRATPVDKDVFARQLHYYELRSGAARK